MARKNTPVSWLIRCARCPVSRRSRSGHCGSDAQDSPVARSAERIHSSGGVWVFSPRNRHIRHLIPKSTRSAAIGSTSVPLMRPGEPRKRCSRASSSEFTEATDTFFVEARFLQQFVQTRHQSLVGGAALEVKNVIRISQALPDTSFRSRSTTPDRHPGNGRGVHRGWRGPLIGLRVTGSQAGSPHRQSSNQLHRHLPIVTVGPPRWPILQNIRGRPTFSSSVSGTLAAHR